MSDRIWQETIAMKGEAPPQINHTQGAGKALELLVANMKRYYQSAVFRAQSERHHMKVDSLWHRCSTRALTDDH